MGKGSGRRPTDEQAYGNNYDAIFGKKKKEDLLGTYCLECNEGMYYETSNMDDINGTLHCEQCSHEVKRYV